MNPIPPELPYQKVTFDSGLVKRSEKLSKQLGDLSTSYKVFYRLIDKRNFTTDDFKMLTEELNLKDKITNANLENWIKTCANEAENENDSDAWNELYQLFNQARKLTLRNSLDSKKIDALAQSLIQAGIIKNS
ncbi:hypothetical protein BN1013_02079 [Candidatus Rubidus massiliensis]|nr:hypothetical protein BN1013_02079 [Candidatus Rubidus massiliensis]